MVNMVILVGNVGKDPEIFATKNGGRLAKFSLATSEKWKAQDGSKQERTEWHRVTVFGSSVEFVATHIRKGTPLFIEGKIQTTKSERDGITKYFTEVIAKNIRFVGSKKEKSEVPLETPTEGEHHSTSLDELPNEVPF